MSKLYEECFSLFFEALGQVDKESEYVQFIQDNKKWAYVIHNWLLLFLPISCSPGYFFRDQPSIELFEFDGSLLHAPCAPGNVQAGQIAINNLTHKAMIEK